MFHVKTIQQSRFPAIKKAVTNRVLQELVKLAEATRIISRKFGSISAAVLRRLYRVSRTVMPCLAWRRFATSTHRKRRGLKDYVAGLQTTRRRSIIFSRGSVASVGQSAAEGSGQEESRFAVAGPGRCFLGPTGWLDGKPFKSVTQARPDSKPFLEGATGRAAAEPLTRPVFARFTHYETSSGRVGRGCPRL